MQTLFIFFDLGNVLLKFNVRKLARQTAALCRCTEEQVLEAAYGGGMQHRVETGTIEMDEFYETFCQRIGNRPDRETLNTALSDMFWTFDETQPLLKHLSDIDFPRGIISNIGVGHWEYCTRTFPFIQQYLPHHHILSYRTGIMKPDKRIYQIAYETAQRVVPNIEKAEVMFLDDMPNNVLSAQEFGFNAIQWSGKETDNVYRGIAGTPP
ncbi:MAG: HAD family phosphatase [Planctomycetaceae bacterium]|jgi:FMN phosphatase YigB (HAD superfamily)|nr:HAD family phosphatase [Planctomycetaceae bacterium]